MFKLGVTRWAHGMSRKTDLQLGRSYVTRGPTPKIDGLELARKKSNRRDWMGGGGGGGGGGWGGQALKGT